MMKFINMFRISVNFITSFLKFVDLGIWNIFSNEIRMILGNYFIFVSMDNQGWALHRIQLIFLQIFPPAS